jgi:hypothetical protein
VWGLSGAWDVDSVMENGEWGVKGVQTHSLLVSFFTLLVGQTVPFEPCRLDLAVERSGVSGESVV